MKIVVVSYDELNKRPTRDDVMKDILKAYNTSSQECKENMGKRLSEQLTSFIEGKTEIIYPETSSKKQRYEIEKIVAKEHPDLLVSYNLAGFELSTLTDSLSYNLMDCRQFHIIKKRNVPNRIYLDKLRSINLFIFEDYIE